METTGSIFDIHGEFVVVEPSARFNGRIEMRAVQEEIVPGGWSFEQKLVPVELEGAMVQLAVALRRLGGQNQCELTIDGEADWRIRITRFGKEIGLSAGSGPTNLVAKLCKE